ncbi:MAG: flavin reductase family protein [Halapricum sp.]
MESDQQGLGGSHEVVELEPTELGGYELFVTLGRLVTPRPVGWISTVSEDGQDNIAPYSFVTPASVDPPVLVFTAAPHQDGTMKDTARNAIETGEFVYNVFTAGLLDEMNDSAADVDASEFETAEIKHTDSEVVEPKRVVGCPAWLECTVRETVEIEGTQVIFGDVEHLGIRDDYLDDAELPDVEHIQERVLGHIIDQHYTRMGLLEKKQPD